MQFLRTMVLSIAIGTLPFGAWACSCGEESQLEMMRRATTVFYARIIQIEIPGSWQSMGVYGRYAQSYPMPLDQLIVARYRIIEVLKGDPDPNGIVVSLVFGPGNCSVPFLTGLYYVFFLNEHGWTAMCDGTYPLGWQPDQDAVQKELASLRHLKSLLPSESQAEPKKEIEEIYRR